MRNRRGFHAEVIVLMIMMLTWGMIAIPSVHAVETTSDNYFVLQSVSLGDTNNKMNGFSTSGTLYVSKAVNGKWVDYELWNKGNISTDTNQEKKDSVFGPVRFKRSLKNERISFQTKGLRLVQAVVNQTLAQVKNNKRKDGDFDQEVSLTLLGSYLPGKLAFHLNVQKITLKPGVQALLIRIYSDVFRIEVLPTDASANNGNFSGMYKGALIYSPEDHRLYQMTSEFDARKGEETLQAQDTAFLVGADGKLAYPLIDMREMLDIKNQDRPEPLTSMPAWAMQALKVRQAVSLSSATTAEQASNPGVLPIISQLLELDGFAGIAGLPSSSSLIEAYGKSQGEKAGELAGRFFSTVGSEAIGASGVLPETLLATTAPVVPALATAFSVYTMYTIAADMSAIALAADIGKLTPFEWPKCAPMECLAQADAAFDLKEPYQPTPDPGAVPEPGASGSSLGKVGWVAGGVAIAAGAALGVSLSKKLADETDDSSSDDCDEYKSQVNKCHTVSGGISFEGFLVPTSCGSCPSGSYDSGTNDNVTAGGPYLQCMCN